MSKKEFKTNNFDLIKVLAASQVIIADYVLHLKIQISDNALRMLDLFPGISVFFIISGYLVAASYDNNSLTGYVRNRGLRIIPGLWACILATILVISITGVSFFHFGTLLWLPAQLLGLTYTPHFLSNYGFGSYNGSLWSILVQLQFYILLPICYQLVPKEKLNYLLLGLLVLFVGINFVWEEYRTTNIFCRLLSHTFIPYFYLFLVGVLLHRLRLYKSTFIYDKGIYWLVIYLVFNWKAPEYFISDAFIIMNAFVLAICVLSLAYTVPTLAKKMLRNYDISYGLFLYHGLIITVIVQQKLTSQFDLFIIFVLSSAAAFLSWKYIERFFLKLKRKTIKATY